MERLSVLPTPPHHSISFLIVIFILRKLGVKFPFESWLMNDYQPMPFAQYLAFSEIYTSTINNLLKVLWN